MILKKYKITRKTQDGAEKLIPLNTFYQNIRKKKQRNKEALKY